MAKDDSYPNKVLPKNFTLGDVFPEFMRSLSKPKTQRRESDSVVKSELNGRISNSQGNASSWKPK